MFGFGKKPKAHFEISWPVESNRDVYARDVDVYAHPPRRDAPLPPIPTRSETSSIRSVHSSTSSDSSYFSSYSIEEQDEHTPVISMPPRTYRMAESTRILSLYPQRARPISISSSTTGSRHSPTSSHSSQPSCASSNTMYTARRSSTAAATVSSCDDGSCEMGDPNSEQMFEQLQDQDQIQVSDSLPDANAIDSAGNIPIFDSEGNSRPFKSIYSGDSAIGEQQMVLFVRHFFCGVSSPHPSIAPWPCHTDLSTGMSSIHQSSL